MKSNRPSDTGSATIRNAVRALIVRNNQVLLLHKRGSDGIDRFSMPGGGQEAGERLTDTLQRECEEEIGAKVDVVGLVHVADVFKETSGRFAPRRQHVELVFRCRVSNDYVPRNGSRPDKNQIGVEWVGLQHLDSIDLRPPGLVQIIRTAALGRGQIYLGEL